MEIRFGNISIKQMRSNGHYWLENEEGEGMGIDPATFHKELTALFNRLF